MHTTYSGSTYTFTAAIVGVICNMASREIKLLVSVFRWAEDVREQGVEKDIWSLGEARLLGIEDITTSFMICTAHQILFE